MRADTPDEFLRRNGLSHKKHGDEYQIDCPKCGKVAHTYMNSRTFLWHCKVCDAKGNERVIKQLLGLQYEIESPTGLTPEEAAVQQMAAEMRAVRGLADVEKWTNALLSDPRAEAARQYLASRGMTGSMIAQHRLGWCANADGTMGAPGTAGVSRRRRIEPASTPDPNAQADGWVVIPAFTKWASDGRGDPQSVACVKIRNIPPAKKNYRRIAGGDSALYAPCGFPQDKTKPLLLVGGEMDALTAVAAGWPGVVSSTTGESGWSDAWSVLLEAYEDIVVIFDNDAPGVAAAAAIAEKLGAHRVRVGQWPTGFKDANEAYCTLGQAFDVAACVQASKPAGGDNVVRVSSLRAAYKAALRGTNPRGISSGWDDLDAVMGGVRDGEVTLLTGDTSSGKSTFGSQWAIQMATQGTRTLVCPFEMGPQRQLDKWVRQWSQRAPDTLSDVDLDAALDTLDAMPIWLLNRYGTIRVEPMRNTLLYAIKKLGVKFVLVDHIHFMVDEGPAERAELDQMMKMLAEVAVDCRVHIVVVAHPRQHSASDEKHRDNRIIQMSDLKGSSGLKQLSDNILSVWRPRKADRTGVVTSGFGVANVYVLKLRSDFGVEGSVGFKFVIEGARYEPPDSAMIAAFKAAAGMNTEADSTSPDNVPNGAPAAPRPRRQRTSQMAKPGAPAGDCVPTEPPARKHWTETDDDEDL
jgi:KaiC/GvpD/RAD55 family RecA-like ATPase